MSSLAWPGDHRAAGALDDAALVAAVLRIETTWAQVLVEAGVAPAAAAFDIDAEQIDVAEVARRAEGTGTFVVPVLAQLRPLLPGPAASWLHRGLTSQDVVDTAFVLLAQDAVARTRTAIERQVATLVDLIEQHRTTPMVARTLTQPAVPTTFGVKAATWLQGVCDARDELAGLRFPVQLGGAAGTLAALVELGGVDAARDVTARFGPALGLDPAAPWHTNRTPITRIGDAATRAASAWGRIANDVLVLARPEAGELSDTSAGGSSTMPGKANPTLAVLVRRHALAAPQLGATLHLAAAEQVDERADGGWHAEWAAFATLLRRTVVAAEQTADLLARLEVHTDRMAAQVSASASSLWQEQAAMAELVGAEPQPDYLGLSDDIIAATLRRAATTPAPGPDTGPDTDDRSTP